MSKDTYEYSTYWDNATLQQMSMADCIRWYGTIRDWHVQLAKRIVDNKYITIFDVGCGLCIIDATLMEKFPSYNYYYKGSEVTKKWIRIAKKNNCNIVFGNAYDIKEPDESYDVVLSLDVLNHLRDFKKPIAEMIRVSKKEVFISFFKEFKSPSEIEYKYEEHNLIYHYFNKQEIIDYLDTFSNIKYEFVDAERWSIGRGQSYELVQIHKSIFPDESEAEWAFYPQENPVRENHENLIITKV